MFKKIISVGLLIITLSVASSVSIFAQAKLSDENQTVSTNKETQNGKAQDSFLKKEAKSPFEEKDNLAAYNKQKSQGKKFSTTTKILIGVGIGAAILTTILVIRYGVNE